MQRENRASHLKMDNLKIKKPKVKVTDRIRPMMGYTFLSNINFSIDKISEKYYFSNLDSLGPPTPSHHTFYQSSPTIGFPVVVDT